MINNLKPKLLFIVYRDFDTLSNGLKKKINSQVSSLKKNGYHVKFIEQRFNQRKLLYNKILHRLGLSIINNEILNEIRNNDYDYIYIRKPLFTFSFLKHIKRIKELTNSIKILEVPTFPYYKELKKTKYSFLLILVDKCIQKSINNYFNYVFSFNNFEKMFGIPNISITNCTPDLNFKIDVNRFDNIINMVAVSTISFDQGFDRVINGLYEYYKTSPTIDVYFYLVGEGKELSKLKRLSKKLEIEKKIFFMGVLSGDELKHIYELSHIGISSLAPHRKNLTEACPLKSREYIALGLPFISSYYDKKLIDFKYNLNIPIDDSALNIFEVISFMKKLSQFNFQSEIIQFGKEELNWGKIYTDAFKQIRNSRENNV